MSRAIRAMALAVVLCVAAGCEPGDRPPLADRSSAGGLDVTFLVTADTHFGAEVRVPAPESASGFVVAPIEPVVQRQIERMNAIEGRAYPPAVGGEVGRVAGVLVAGDLTDDGRADHWRRFEQSFGLTGRDGLLKFPVFETVGNHDGHWLRTNVRRQVARRHGAVRYAWHWGDLQLICLGDGPDDAGLRFLRRELASVGRRLPVVLYQHYPLAGPYSENNWFGRGGWRRRLADAIEGFNVIAIFHGHYHGSSHYVWNGRDVYNVGSARHGARQFAVAHVTDGRLTVCSWDFGSQFGGWSWWHVKEVGRASRDQNAIRPASTSAISAAASAMR